MPAFGPFPAAGIGATCGVFFGSHSDFKGADIFYLGFGETIGLELDIYVGKNGGIGFGGMMELTAGAPLSTGVLVAAQ